MDDLIFFVLPQDIVYFEILTQSTVVHQIDSIYQDNTSQAIFNGLKYKNKLEFISTDFKNITVPCIPAKQHIISINKQNNQNLNLYSKIIKVPHETTLKGYLSGKRSAIMVQNGQLIRYKGCGNLKQGFIIQQNELRGCHYLHTAKRQMYMTKLINQILLQRIGIRSGNQPIMFYEITSQIKKWQLQYQLPLLPKYCCIFKTDGDRRAGTHLISPLEILFLSLTNCNSIQWFNIFQSKSRINCNQPIEFIANWQLFLNEGQLFLQKYDSIEFFKNYIEINKIQIHNHQDINQRFKKLLKQYQININNNIMIKVEQIQWFKIIIIIIQKIGWQIGHYKRIFSQEGINWGFFNDHGNNWHCNAHLNNFIILKPQYKKPLLTPIDFDLAFIKKQFIVHNYDSPYYGCYNQFNFQQLMCSQYIAMQMSLSGLQIMNFNYSIISQNNNNSNNNSNNSNNNLKMSRISFRDELICNFRYGMSKNYIQYQKINFEWNNNIKYINIVIELCLQMSCKFQT